MPRAPRAGIEAIACWPARDLNASQLHHDTEAPRNLVQNHPPWHQNRSYRSKYGSIVTFLSFKLPVLGYAKGLSSMSRLAVPMSRGLSAFGSVLSQSYDH